MGCFWKPAEELRKVPGVLDTVAGYTGRASSFPPSYEQVCMSRDFVEAVRVYYDDKITTYPQLLDAFFQTQEPRLGSRQYASIIFPQTADEQEMAKQWLAEHCDRVRNDGVAAAWTTVESPTPFFRAEPYHQQYWEKTRPRIAAMLALLAIASGVLDDTVATHFVDATILRSVANALILVGGLYVIAERKLDSKVEMLD
jgi:peptide-methionine (S)-S-oxide reductase